MSHLTATIASLHTIERSAELYEKAKRLIPGGTQLLSKRPEFHAPDQWPAYYQSAQGCEVIDLDGNKYLDMSLMGVGACLLGYADPDVSAAVVRAISNGSMCTLNSPDEVRLAEVLLELHPWAQMARFCRSGGEAMSAAVRIARAATGRTLVAFCGYHGWQDWYLAANRAAAGESDSLKGHMLPGLSPAGVPPQLAGTALPFTYNKIAELAAIVRNQGSHLAAVVMEPTRSVDPEPGFLEGVRELCDKVGALFVIDEISAGWRFALGGAHLKYGVAPDIAVFSKALGNGHPMAAIVGRSEAMEAAQQSFISSTYWTEAVGPAAALAVIDKLRHIDVPTHVARIGEQFRAGMLELGDRHRLSVKLSGHPALTSIAFEHADSLALITLMTVRMLKRGFLCGSGFYPSFAHKSEHVNAFLEAADSVFEELSAAARSGDAAKQISGPVKHTGFSRLA
jgi:glutamate-1-semialdehyde 2,1-aminomutase